MNPRRALGALDQLALTSTMFVLLTIVGATLVTLAWRAAAPRPPRSLRDALDDRFARGELSIDEYRHERRLIDHD